MTQQTKRPNLLPYLLVLLVLVGVYGFMNKPVEAEPSYAEVRELFESEQVSAFTVTDTTLRMKLRESILRAEVMLLRHIGRAAAADRLEAALNACPVVITGQPDGATCADYGDGILKLL